MQLRQAVVVTNFGVLEPVTRIASAVVAQGTDARREFGILRHDYAAFCGRNLFVGIKSKYADIADRANFLAAIIRAEGLAGVFDQE